MIVGLVDNEYPSGSSMSASVIICIVLLGLIPEIEPALFGFRHAASVCVDRFPGRPEILDYQCQNQSGTGWYNQADETIRGCLRS